MGQYFVAANLDAQEYLAVPGDKATEQTGNWIGTPHALMLLLGTGMGRGGGDFCTPTGPAANKAVVEAFNDQRHDDAAHILAEESQRTKNDPILGRWSGQRIVFVGDYYKQGDVTGVTDPDLYHTILNTYTDIALQVRPYLDTNFPH